jgi:transposase
VYWRRLHILASQAPRLDTSTSPFGSRGPTPNRPQGGGRRRAGDRETLAAIVFVATSGCTWRQLPPVFGPAWPTVYRRFAQWSRARVWARLHRVILDELGARGQLDWSRCAIDSVSVRATKGGP